MKAKVKVVKRWFPKRFKKTIVKDSISESPTEIDPRLRGGRGAIEGASFGGHGPWAAAQIKEEID